MRRFWVPAILAVCVIFIAGGLFFKNRGLESPTLPEEAEEVKGAFENIPLYQGAEILSSSETEDGWQLTLRSKDPSEKIESFYQQKIKEGENIEVEITPAPDSSETIIILTYSSTK